jgi:glutamine synthetase
MFLNEFKRSKLMKETLGEHVFNKYLETKTAEWSDFQKSITAWELKRYRDV